MIPDWGLEEGAKELLAGCLGGALIFAVFGWALQLIGLVLMKLWEKRYLGWAIIALFAPLFWLVGWAWQGLSGQFCETWKGLWNPPDGGIASDFRRWIHNDR